jgi:hypothetical protein
MRPLAIARRGVRTALVLAVPLVPEQLKVGPEGELSLTGVASPVANAGPTETVLARITPEGNLDL